jgi:putative CocE/NonD family hydrolase
MSNVPVYSAFNHLPVIEAAEQAGCPTPKYWDDWFDHQFLDAYWRALGIEARLDRVEVPVLGMAGWYDDARGTIRNYVALDALPDPPFQRIVMGPGAHKGIDYVNGDFGPQARVERSRAMQARWFDRWLKGIDNGVDREPPVDIFIMGENVWRQENEWPLARTTYTNYYLHSGGAANTAGGDGTLDTHRPGDEPADTFTYDPGDPTPYLIDARELELGLNVDYSAVHAARNDVLAFTTAPFTEPVEVTGPMTATLWAATDARDTDWNVMILEVHPDGSAWRMQDGIMRARFRDGFDRPTPLEPGRVYRYDIDVWFTSRVIPPGNRLRVVVSSAAFPKYDRNLNTGGDNERDTEYVSAHQRVLHDGAHPSHVTLPIIPRDGS